MVFQEETAHPIQVTIGDVVPRPPHMRRNGEPSFPRWSFTATIETDDGALVLRKCVVFYDPFAGRYFWLPFRHCGVRIAEVPSRWLTAVHDALDIEIEVGALGPAAPAG